jgi:hypothetical protein
MSSHHVSRLLGDADTKRKVKWYVVQDANGHWHASRDAIWGSGHWHRFMVRATSVQSAIAAGKLKLR